MSKKIGMNVALGLSTGGFSKGLDGARAKLDKFAKDIKRQNELASKFGAAGLGRGFGIAGRVFEGASMGGVAGGLTGVVAGFAGMAASIKLALTAINTFNKSAMDARKTMDLLAEGKAPLGSVTGFTPLAAKANTVRGDVTFGEVGASNFAPRSASDAMKMFLVSAAPNVATAVGSEVISWLSDKLLGRQTGSLGSRVQASGQAALAGEFGPIPAQMAARELEAIRRGQQQQTEVMRGN